MASLRRLEGQYISDNRVSGGALQESAAVRCAHCHSIVLLHLGQPRLYCSNCDRYLCERPECHANCVPFEKVLDLAQTAAFKDEQSQKGTIWTPKGGL